MRSSRVRAGAPRALGIAILLLSASAAAQRGKPAPEPPPPPRPSAPPPGSEVVDLLKIEPGGLTAEQVGALARQTSFVVRGARDNERVASSRVGHYEAFYVPTLTLTARYTRLSNFTNTTPPPAPGPLDNTFLDAYLTIPLSDYVLISHHAVSAFSNYETAASYDTAAARARAYADGKLAFFAWLRGRGALTVGRQTLAVAKAHEHDAEILLGGGMASPADVLRAKNGVAAAELVVAKAENALRNAENTIRIAMHSKDSGGWAPGESLDTDPPAVTGTLPSLVAEAVQKRPELHSLVHQAEGYRDYGRLLRGAMFPQVQAFGEATYANPNARLGTSTWFPSWAAGVQAVWVPNNIFLGGTNIPGQDPAGAFSAHADQTDDQYLAERDAIELEVTTAYGLVVQADQSIQSTKRQLDAATDGYRIARDLYNGGRSTSTALLDAEAVLAQARFDNLDAKIDARVARVQLDHAVGRDVVGSQK